MTHVVSIRALSLLLVALLLLTGLTLGVAYVDLGRWNLAVALLIAGTKATLVALGFMHAWYASKVVKLMIVGGLFWLALLLGLTLTDYLTR